MRSMKVAIPSLFFGGGGGVSEKVKTLGEPLPPLNDQGQLFRDPAPLPEFLDPPLA